MSLKAILHVLADGISLSGPARDELHRAIEDHDQPADVSRETTAAGGGQGESDVSRETASPAVPARPVTRAAGA
jgi:hypothetical protein